MRNLILFLHLAAAIFWMGGMAFTVLALRPVLHAALEPALRLPIMVRVLGRFFAVVAASIAVLLPSGLWMFSQSGMNATPPGWHAMATLGALMMLVFGHIFFSPYRRLKLAVAALDWPEAGRRMGQITLLVKINLGLGWLAIAAVMLWR
ncbi:MAG TPA: CopD family protein [Ramlibacter sp.]|uniref:CopD family protein n=1 Tax=Ramlibacter sp. TaxID=1917967 RepID=UPI002BB46EDE|nr:CopD family protein [Ramlibacter sp.]HVZ46789.1 CopD family protein [Ramlibacter sp.]